MKIMAIEIRQHTFEKGLRGYKTEDVDAFLVSLSQEWERVTGDYKMLKMQLEMSEKELGKLKEVEMTLFRTLKMAEDTSAQITDQATKAGELHVAEAKQKADDILADARKRSVLMVQDAENQARYLKDNILNDLKAMEHDFKALESYKESLTVQIRALASNAIDSVDRFEKKFAKQNLKGKIEEVTTQIVDDRKRDAEQNQLGTATASLNGAVTELPPLTERETAIPDVIPVDELTIAQTDQVVDHDNADSALAPIAEVTDMAMDGDVPNSQPEQTEERTTQPEIDEIQSESTQTIEERKEKSGSFFDQI